MCKTSKERQDHFNFVIVELSAHLNFPWMKGITNENKANRKNRDQISSRGGKGGNVDGITALTETLVLGF